MAAAPAGGASDAQARFGRSVKGLLIDRVTGCGTDVIALTKQVLKGSRSSELLGHAARNMVMQEDAILHSEDKSKEDGYHNHSSPVPTRSYSEEEVECGPKGAA
ncbi:unnamed protein product [Caretta caretta]